jgi:nucleoside 2-deoxyribosyltransferase
MTDSLGNFDDVPVIQSDTIRRLIEEDPRLPSPGQLATNVIRIVGEHVAREFDTLDALPAAFQARVGAPNRRYADKIVNELMHRGLLSAIDAGTLQHPDEVIDIDLTLAGWEVFEAERKGKIASSFGFIALKFGDSILDPLLAHHVKPKLAEMGYPLVDLRDVSRAGVIDNLLRAQIRDSAFIIVDLTHDNLGAYWEAGYAEGLGKPVIYICERSKFEEKKTHFDTNHCTTVTWATDDPDDFVAELGATIRRSLDFA